MAIAFVGNKEEAVSDFPVAPPGTYFIKVLKADEQKSKKSGRDMFKLEYVIAEGEYEGIHLWSYLTLIEAGAKGHGMTLSALKAHGFDADGEIELSAEGFEGLTVQAVLDVETYEGRKKNVIKRYVSEDPAGTAQEPQESKLAKSATAAGLTKPKGKMPWKR